MLLLFFIADGLLKVRDVLQVFLLRREEGNLPSFVNKKNVRFYACEYQGHSKLLSLPG